MNDKYLLFCGSDFYPFGGYEDFKGVFDCIDSAKKWINSNDQFENLRWVHIVKDHKIILCGSNDNYVPGEWKWRDEE